MTLRENIASGGSFATASSMIFTARAPTYPAHRTKRPRPEKTTPYTEVDLTDTLHAIGVAPATIGLLDREIGADGMLIMVDAGVRCDEGESILERNRGMVRTVMATEQAKVTS